MESGVVVSRAIEGAEDPEASSDVCGLQGAGSQIPSHRMLAIRRGAKEESCISRSEMEAAKPLMYLNSKVIREQEIGDRQLGMAIEDSYERLPESLDTNGSAAGIEGPLG